MMVTIDNCNYLKDMTDMQFAHSGGLEEGIGLDINKRNYFHFKNGRRCKTERKNSRSSTDTYIDYLLLRQDDFS